MKSSFFWGSTVSRNTIEAAQAAVLKPKDGLQLAIKQLLTRCLKLLGYPKRFQHLSATNHPYDCDV